MKHILIKEKDNSKKLPSVVINFLESLFAGYWFSIEKIAFAQ